MIDDMIERLLAKLEGRRRRCPSCGRRMHRVTVRYFGGPRQTYQCAKCPGAPLGQRRLP